MKIIIMILIFILLFINSYGQKSISYTNLTRTKNIATNLVSQGQKIRAQNKMGNKINVQNGIYLISITNESIDSIVINNTAFPLSFNPKQHLSISEYKLFTLKTKNRNYIIILSPLIKCNSLWCRIIRFNIFDVTNKTVTQFSDDIVYGDIRNVLDYNNDGYLDLIECKIDDSKKPINENEYYDYHKIRIISIKNGRVWFNNYNIEIKYDRVLSEKKKDFFFRIVNGKWFEKIK